ncbi:hypothetical protein IID24_03015 [Patescibacteria group bacterium]|nr:hypothetical protein [Patescibacteria group bacterium]
MSEEEDKKEVRIAIVCCDGKPRTIRTDIREGETFAQARARAVALSLEVMDRVRQEVEANEKKKRRSGEKD